MSALWREIQPWRWRKKMPSPNHTPWRVTYRVDALVTGLALLWETLQFTRQTFLSCSNPKIIPLLIFSMTWPLDHRGSSSRLVQDSPERRSWWETGELSLTTETPTPFQTAVDVNLKEAPPVHSGSVELQDNLWISNKIEDAVEIEVN